MTRRLTTLAAVFVLALAGRAAAAPYSVKVEDAPPPAELGEPIRALLDAKAMSVYDGTNLLCTIWPRKALPAKAAKAGLAYTDLDETTVVGAIKLPKVWPDYRKQKIKPGVYTLRLSIQPMNGDHMGTAPYNEFLLLSPAAKDVKPDLLEPKALHELSATAVGASHPGIMLLYPNPKPSDAPAVEAKENETWVLSFRRPVTAGGQAGVLGFSAVVVGHSMSE
jgi:hypothetical protein